MNLRHQRGVLRTGVLALALILLGGNPVNSQPRRSEPAPVLLVVMDPLAKELACACMAGYGQRDYRKLAAQLGTALKQRVSIEFSDDLADTMALAGPGREVVVIGERSRVVHGAGQAGLKCRPVAELTDRDGGTALTGVFVVPRRDPAKELKDLAGRKVFFGMAETEVNRAATRAALSAAGVEAAGPPEKRSSYSEAALDVLDSTATPLPVAVIPGYAPKLLEGCGSVKPGELRVIGRTEPVPFITVFLADNLGGAKEEKILKLLLGLKSDATMLKVLESRDGFKPIGEPKTGAPQANARLDWPDWRGPNRNGQVPRLPARLPETPTVIWKKAGMAGSLAGLSVGDGRLMLAERDFADEYDVYRCLQADTGTQLWRAEFPSRGKLDYGQAPRATPVIHGGKAYLLGAFGELRCVDLASGAVIWKRHLVREFQAALPTWGMTATPLIVDDLLIVNPGGTNAALAALDGATGATRWTTPGAPAAYAAFICGEFGGRRQLVGYDQRSLGGWDVKTGARLWQLIPATEGDFNVPTPIALNGGVLVATENNGTRFYRFDDAGRIIPTPAGRHEGLAPDTATPVVARGRVFGAHLGLHCLDTQEGLKPVWYHEDDSVGDYASLLADEERVLVITVRGELILLDAQADECTVISRVRVFPGDVEVYSHPALAGTRLYLRGGSSVLCLDLAAN